MRLALFVLFVKANINCFSQPLLFFCLHLLFTSLYGVLYFDISPFFHGLLGSGLTSNAKNTEFTSFLAVACFIVYNINKHAIK